MTLLEIVNRVCRRLREDPVTSLAETTYSRMVADFLADVHDECMEHDWSSMEHIVNVPVDASQRVLDLSQTETDGGDVDDNDRLPTVESFILYDCDTRPLAWVFDSDTDEEGQRLIYASTAEVEQLYQQGRAETNQDPAYFALRNHPERDGLELILWPPPNVARHIRISFWTPEAPIDVDADSNRTLLVPSRPLTLGTLYLALNERGEEMGEPGGTAQVRYEKALEKAVEADQNRRSLAGRFVAQRD